MFVVVVVVVAVEELVEFVLEVVVDNDEHFPLYKRKNEKKILDIRLEFFTFVFQFLLVVLFEIEQIVEKLKMDQFQL
jgi:hypothetical protein